MNPTTKEREILKLFYANPAWSSPTVASSKAAWSTNEAPLTNVADVYVGSLRRKLSEQGRSCRRVEGQDID
ncbi:winged helix-turn-helix domain-containing protein [Denitrobaculum tricleocarpae]|uniref:winged helix-turn-helix domain-containing protein n=1 Tax=Denitrobaculum tricleocarpae TaxID=2591009 RepID=UPI0015D23C59|nr:helix-turn-helix domain-containing protein [Denitrobaculum tricleocarpae]